MITRPSKLTKKNLVQLIAVFLFLCFFNTLALSSTWYVKPSSELPLRRGQGTEYKIIGILLNGDKVTLVEDADPWVKIVTEEGKEGWILKRYLSQDTPLNNVIENLNVDNKTLKDELQTLTQESKELNESVTQLSNKLKSTSTELEKVQHEHQQLLKDTADVVAIKNDLVQSKETIKNLKQELGIISAENARIKDSQNIKWFLAGGGTLIFGCIIGMLIAKSKKRKPSLY